MIPLLNKNEFVDENVVFEIKKDGSGINLEKFDYEGIEVVVNEVISYSPSGNGKEKIGAGQLGFYKVTDRTGNYYAAVKDYKALEGDWRIYLVGFARTMEELTMH